MLKDIKVRSRGTYLGIAWALMNPLMSIGVYFVVFRYIFQVTIPNFLAFFVVGFLMWVFFSRAAMAAVTCIVDNEAIIRRSAFPLEVLPLATVLYHLYHHVLAFGIALALLESLGGARPTWHLFWIAGITAAFAVFTLAAALGLSTLGVFFRDTATCSPARTRRRARAGRPDEARDRP